MIHTTNGSIRGSFNATRMLNLRTSNAGIHAVASITHPDETPSHPLIGLHTTHGLINASISLFNQATRKNNVSFEIVADTIDAPLKLHILEIPSDVKLIIAGYTTKTPIHAKIHPAYEGSFAIKTTNNHVTVITPDAEDPRREGRTRSLEQRHWDPRGGHIIGSVRWNSEELERHGNIHLSTTKAPIRLTL
jgi:hypothetical protein